TAKKFLDEFARFYNVGIIPADFSIHENSIKSYPNDLNIGSKVPRSKRTVDIQPQAECVPELKTVPLIAAASAGNDDDDGGGGQHRSNNQDLYYPHCIRLPRCGGCCPSQRLVCRPKSITWRNISVSRNYKNFTKTNYQRDMRTGYAHKIFTNKTKIRFQWH
ncbi:hypothetical protein BLA29_010140, partial [Euroglyphus maynei]